MGRLATERKYQIQELQDIHREIMRRLVAGQKHLEIASALDVTPVMVSYVANSNLARAEINRLHDMADMQAIDVNLRMKELAPALLEVAASIALDPEGNSKTRAHVALELMDRAGYSKVHKSLVASHQLTEDEIAALKQNGVDAGIVIPREKPVCADVTPICAEAGDDSHNDNGLNAQDDSHNDNGHFLEEVQQ